MGIPTVGPTFYSNLRMTNRNKGRIIESLASILLGAGSGAAEEELFEIPPEAMKPGSKASVVQQRLNEQKASSDGRSHNHWALVQQPPCWDPSTKIS